MSKINAAKSAELENDLARKTEFGLVRQKAVPFRRNQGRDA